MIVDKAAAGLTVALAFILLAPTGASVSVDSSSLAQPIPAAVVVVSDALEAAKCALPESYSTTNQAWYHPFSDDGRASFQTQFDVPALLGYQGSGGHVGTVLRCYKGDETWNGYMATRSDFTWGGSDLLGNPGGITIWSAGHGVPMTFNDPAEQALDYASAKAEASTIQGEYQAQAIHGGILAPESAGVASLNAEGNWVLNTYAYRWTYEGTGSPLGLDEIVHDNPVCHYINCTTASVAIGVYGAGADKDMVT